MVSYAQLNRLVRILIVVIVTLSAILFVAAARPLPRYQGSYLATLDQPEPIIGTQNQPIAYVTVSHPSIVSFPAEWKLPSAVCLIVVHARGTAALDARFNDGLPEAHWDDRPDDLLLIDTDSVAAQAVDHSLFTFAIPTIAPIAAVHMPFRVHWFDTLHLSVNQAIRALLCYWFEDSQHTPRIPPAHVLRFNVTNTNSIRAPAYYFRYNDSAPAPPMAITLSTIDFESYLGERVIDTPDVVVTMTATQ